MEVSEEKLKELADIFQKVRFFMNQDGEEYLDETNQARIDTLAQNLDVIKENFKYFSKRTSSIMYPEDFLRAVKALPGGGQILADNFEYILQAFTHKKTRARYSLVGVPEVSEKVAGDFEHLFKLAMYRDVNQPDLTGTPDLRYLSCCDSTRKNDFDIFMRYIAQAEDPSEVLEQNKDLFLNYAYDSAMLSMVNILAENPKCHKFIRNNIGKIKEVCYVPQLAELCDAVRNICPEEFEKDAFMIDQIYLPAMKELDERKVSGKQYYNTLSQINLTCSEMIKQGRSKDFEGLVNFIMENSENKEMKICGSGFFNITIKAGDKAIKIGGNEGSSTERKDMQIPYHPRMLLPIMRRKDDSIDKDHPVFIAIYETVDTDIEITDEELLEVYRELREDGIKWLDVKKENLGRLKKDNLQYEIGANMSRPLNYLGFIESGVEPRTLSAGELVILDLDFFYLDGKADNLPFISEDVPRCIVDYEADFLKRQEEEKAGKVLVKKKPEAPNFDEH